MSRDFKRSVSAILGWPNFLRGLQWPVIQRLIDLDSSKLIVDLGAGPMLYSRRLAKGEEARVVAADLDFRVDYVTKAKRDLVRLLRADGLALPFADHSIDCLMMSSLLQLVPDPAQLLSECHRVLRPHGALVLTVPNHYRFIPMWMKSSAGPALRRSFGLPPELNGLIKVLNRKFDVYGPAGYYSREELLALLEAARFTAVNHEYAPGWLGSLLWEMAVIGSVRFGKVPFCLLLLVYPLARLYDATVGAEEGCEHILKATPQS